MNVSMLNVLLEFAPVPAEQPTYIGLGTTLMAPIAFGGPLAAGLLADALGYAAVFGSPRPRGDRARGHDRARARSALDRRAARRRPR